MPPPPEAGHVRIRVSHAPVHPGDLHFIRGTIQAGPAVPVDVGGRIPGFEGFGVIDELGAGTVAAGLAPGTRVAFFPAKGAWTRYLNVPTTSLAAIDDAIDDQVAAQVLINSITAQIALETGHASLPPDAGTDVAIIQTAAGSSVGRLITAFAINQGLTPLRLVRSLDGAAALERAQPDIAVFATTDPAWKEKVREAAGGRPLWSALDSVGGTLLGNIADLLSDGATVVSYGSLSDEISDVRSFSPRGLALKGVNIGAYGGFSAEKKKGFIKRALSLARTQPALFDTAGVFDAADFASAFEQATRPGKPGAVLLKF